MKYFLTLILLFSINLYAESSLDKIKKAAVKNSHNDNETTIQNKKIDEPKKSNSKISIGIENTVEFHSTKVKLKK